MTEKESDYAMKHSEEEVVRLELQAAVLSDVIDHEIDVMKIKSGMSILDAGCGSGAITRKFAQIVKPAQVTAIDFDPVFIENAKAIAADEGLNNINFENGDLDNLKYQDGTFDLTYCRLVLMHVEDPVRTVSELKRVTRTGGFVAISDNDDDAIIIHPSFPRVTELWRKYGEWSKTKRMDRHIGRQLFSILSQAGLNSIRIFPYSIYRTQENPEQFRMFASVPIQIMAAKKTELLEQGIFSEEEYDLAMEEFEAMVNNPGGFIMTTLFFAIGEVP